MNHLQQKEVGQTAEDLISYDLHLNEEIRNSYNWNLQCMIYAIIFEVVLMVMYQVWQVYLITCFTGILNLFINIVWIVLPLRIKGRVEFSNYPMYLFYTLQAILFCFFIGSCFYFLSTTFDYEWTDQGYLWSDIWLMSGIYLAAAAAFAALHTYSFGKFVFVYRRQLRYVTKNLEK